MSQASSEGSNLTAISMLMSIPVVIIFLFLDHHVLWGLLAGTISD
jgi:ABC-type glycerol-3-phosphate transport system permease component